MQKFTIPVNAPKKEDEREKLIKRALPLIGEKARYTPSAVLQKVLEEHESKQQPPVVQATTVENVTYEQVFSEPPPKLKSPKVLTEASSPATTDLSSLLQTIHNDLSMLDEEIEQRVGKLQEFQASIVTDLPYFSPSERQMIQKSFRDQLQVELQHLLTRMSEVYTNRNHSLIQLKEKVQLTNTTLNYFQEKQNSMFKLIRELQKFVQ